MIVGVFHWFLLLFKQVISLNVILLLSLINSFFFIMLLLSSSSRIWFIVFLESLAHTTILNSSGFITITEIELNSTFNSLSSNFFYYNNLPSINLHVSIFLNTIK